MVCDPSMWHIERCKTLAHCLTLQTNKSVVYNLSLQRGIEGDINSQIPSYGFKEKFAIHRHWFYVDDKYRCFMGMK
jgi:hypothetical protein